MFSLRRSAAAALLLLLVSCQRVAEPVSCGRAPNCLAGPKGAVIGSDASTRLAAERELRSAAATYSTWFEGEGAVPGLVLLDAATNDEARIVRGTSWTLRYDLGAKLAMDGGPAVPRSRPEDAGLRGARGDGASLTVSQDNREFEVARPGVLAHEICHRHASRAFEQAWGRTRDFPDMLDEVAAISCETEEMKRARLDLFARWFAGGKNVSWDGFLVTRHPLKSDPAMIRAVTQLRKSARSTAAFDIEPGSSQAGKVALFYSQAAAFGEFVSERSCKGKQAIGQLLSTYDPRLGLDQWLKANGARLCLPSSVAGFEKSFERYIEQRMATQSS